MAQSRVSRESARAVAQAGRGMTFEDLVRLSGLDRNRDFCFADLSGVDFGGSTLDGFNFIGARLIQCKFEGAHIRGARFECVELDVARPDAHLDSLRTDLTKAADWPASFQVERATRRTITLTDKQIRALEKLQLELSLRPARYSTAQAGHAPSTARKQRNVASRSATASDTHLPVGTVFSDAPGIAPEMVVVPAGKFMMGTSADEIRALTKEYGEDYRKVVKREGQQHLVTIAQPFAIGRFPVTFDEWDVFAQDKRRELLNEMNWGRGRRPAINVSWDDAKAYCTWLAERTDKPYRLLTEAEWEYCYRAGTETCYGFGLYDMHGNVSEWCEDAFAESYEDAPDDGTAVQDRRKTVSRVLRGGSWGNYPGVLRAARRSGSLPGYCGHIIGCRLARTLTP